MKGSCEHLLLAYHILKLEDSSEAFGKKRPQKRRKHWGKRGQPNEVEPDVAAAPVDNPPGPSGSGLLTPAFLEITEKEMQKSIRKYEFFEDAQKRRAS